MVENTTLLHHSTIGDIRGLRLNNNVNQFRGVLYATLRDRFSRGELIERYQTSATNGEKTPLDATTHGPLVISPPNGCDGEYHLIQHSLPHEEFTQSDTECLRLNISVPSEVQGGSPGLPVVVFFHGGGFFTGSSSWPQYDVGAFVALSIRIGTPIIAIGVNYRLGVTGYLTSSALRAAGYKANNGLDDQRLALRWVKRHIGGFGGDPTRVTVMGESAGAASASIHLQSKEPLFDQVIIMGGSPFLRPAPAQAAEKFYGMVTEKFGIKELSPEAQVKAFLEMSTVDLSTKSMGIRIPPVVDDDIIKDIPSYKAIHDPDNASKLFPSMKWCKRMMVGDCGLDAMILTIGGAIDNRPEAQPQLLKHGLSDKLGKDASETVSKLLKAYGADPAASINNRETLLPVLRFVHDIGWYYAALASAEAWSESKALGTSAFVYHFNVPNPWEGAWKGYATHALDIAILLQNYNEFLSSGQRACAERFGKDVIWFVNGEEPWKPYEKSVPAAMVYNAKADGDEDESVLAAKGESNLTGRQHFLEDIVGRERFDDLLKVHDMVWAGSR